MTAAFPLDLVAAIAVAMVGTSFLSGVFGMAGGMVLVGVLLALLPLPAAMALHAVTQIASNVWRAVLWRRWVRWRIAAAYVLGCTLAMGVWSLWLFVPSKGVALLMLGVTPFLAHLLPRPARPAPESFRDGVAIGATCMTLLIFTGVAGPLLDSFFLGSRTEAAKLDRRAIVATKGVCQIFGHAAKLLYFGGLIENAASLDSLLVIVAVTASMLGTMLARRVLEAMSEGVYRRWATRIATGIAAWYVAYGAYLVATA